MLQKFDLTPRNSDRITLFANKAEAIVFWLAIAGLLFLAIVSLFRYLTNKQLETGEKFRSQIVRKIESLETQNQSLQNQIDSLKTEIETLQSEIAP